MRAYEVLLFIHLVAVAIWVGGMAIMHFVVRPSAGDLLEPAERLPFMALALGRFFSWVVISILLILLSGAWMIGLLADAARLPPSVHAMVAIGMVMIAIFAYVRLAPYKRLRFAVAAKDWSGAAKWLASIRKWVSVNLALGIITVAVATIGRSFVP